MAYQLLDVDLGGGSVLQYANRDPYQMMGYLLKTPEGKTVMIDGGRWEKAVFSFSSLAGCITISVYIFLFKSYIALRCN